VCARLFNNAVRPPLQAGQTNPCGQRRSNKNAAQLVSSGKLVRNSFSDRALATQCPLSPDADPRRTAAPSYYILTNLGQRDEPCRVGFTPQKLSIELDRQRDNLVSVTFAMAATEFAEASQVVKIISGEIEPP
jgi:hypothetical protein